MQTIGEGAAAICSTSRRGLGRSGMEESSGSMIDAGSEVGCWSAVELPVAAAVEPVLGAFA